jgi:3-phosphoshikimate 1-carboxyvinyltransferase
VLATARAMQAFGARVEQEGVGRWRIEGQGGFSEPVDVIDCGNAGTGVRLIMGAAAGFAMCATFTGDSSLRGRPMSRVLDPLARMGATWLGRDKGRLPLTLKGGNLRGLNYTLPMASAQVKSAVLLAGLHAEGGVEVIEPEATRDHTERMLRAFGAEVIVEDRAVGDKTVRHIRLPEGQKLAGTHVAVPGDPSSAAFPLVAGLIVPGSDVTVEGVMLNGLRTGLFTTLQEMGADLVISNRRMASGEEVGDITARYSQLKGVVVPEDRAPAMIDEYPILAVAAAFADGPTVMRGIGEMRVKESDRISPDGGGPAGLRRHGRGRAGRHDRGRDQRRQSPRARRRPGPHPWRSPDRHEPPDPGHGRPGSRDGRRAGHDRHQLPGLRRSDARARRHPVGGLTWVS